MRQNQLPWKKAGYVSAKGGAMQRSIQADIARAKAALAADRGVQGHTKDVPAHGEGHGGNPNHDEHGRFT